MKEWKVSIVYLEEKVYLCRYKPNKKGALQNQAFPMKIDNQKEYKILGWVTIDGVKYSILESDLDDYVFLFDKDGNFYKNAGVMDDGVLKLVDEEIFIYPSDLKMQNVVKTRDEISNIKTGYEVSFPMPEVPLMVNSEEDAKAYIMAHFWDGFRFGDILLLGNKNVISK